MNSISSALTNFATTQPTSAAKQITASDIKALKDSITRDFFEKVRLEELLFDQKKSASIIVSVQDQLKNLTKLITDKKNKLNEMLQHNKGNEELNILA